MTRVASGASDIEVFRIPWGGCLLAAAALIAAALPARAQNATWDATPENGNFNNQFDWTPNTVPTGTASFNTSNTTGLTFSAPTTIGGWTFNSGASNYTFTLNSPNTLTFESAGIVINGGSATITNSVGSAAGTIPFQNNSTAGSATINNGIGAGDSGGPITFGTFGGTDTSTAGGAKIDNNNGGTLTFNASTTAGSAAIINDNGSSMSFRARRPQPPPLRPSFPLPTRER
jgi:hypothetical protein